MLQCYQHLIIFPEEHQVKIYQNISDRNVGGCVSKSSFKRYHVEFLLHS